MIDRIAIVGHFGGWNAGDEAILASLVTELKQVKTTVEVSAVARRFNKRGRALCDQLEVEPVDLVSWRALQIVTSRRVVIGGGQIITLDKSLRPLLVLLLMITVNRISGKNPAIAFAGVGPSPRVSVAKKLAVRLICLLASYVSVRDDESLASLVHAGVAPGRVRVSADVVLGASLAADPPTLDERGASGVIVVGHRSPHRNLIEPIEIARLIEASQDASRRPTTVLSHDCRTSFDDGLHAELLPHLQHADWRFQRFESLPKHLEIYRTAAVVVSARMHPLILATIFGVPALAVPSSQKVNALAHRLEIPLLPLGLNHLKLVALISEAIKSKPPIASPRNTIKEDVDRLLADDPRLDVSPASR